MIKFNNLMAEEYEKQNCINNYTLYEAKNIKWRMWNIVF